MCKKFFLFTTMQKLLKVYWDFLKLWSQMYCHVFMFHSVNTLKLINLPVSFNICHGMLCLVYFVCRWVLYWTVVNPWWFLHVQAEPVWLIPSRHWATLRLQQELRHASRRPGRLDLSSWWRLVKRATSLPARSATNVVFDVPRTMDLLRPVVWMTQP